MDCTACPTTRWRCYNRESPAPRGRLPSSAPAPASARVTFTGTALGTSSIRRRAATPTVRTLELFAGAYGAAAGNLALTVLASGGVYIAGGIAPKIIRQLASGAFMEAFRNKGRLSSVVARMPVHVILTEDVALYGAAAVAARTLMD